MIPPESYKKLKGTSIGVLAIALNEAFAWGISVEALILITTLLGSYNIGQGIADNGKEAAKVTNGTNSPHPADNPDPGSGA